MADHRGRACRGGQHQPSAHSSERFGDDAVGDPARARWAVAVRVLAGTLGAYGLAALVTVALSLALAALGMNRVEAVHAATLASFAIFAVIAMVVFHARNLSADLGVAGSRQRVACARSAADCPPDPPMSTPAFLTPAATRLPTERARS